MPRTLSTAEERSVAVVSAALRVFARTGYHATPVTEVAAEAGISPAYVFRLFPTKRDLFVAALHECFDRIMAAVRGTEDELTAGAEPDAVLDAMARRYAALIADQDVIMLQVHALAASSDPAIKTALRADHQRLVDFVARHSQATDAALQGFFARGQLCHLATALGAFDSRAHWAVVIGGGLYEPADTVPSTRPARRSVSRTHR